MIPEFAYFLKVNMALVLLYAFYRLFFYKDTFFKLRRTILLVFFGVSVIYPFLDIQDWIRGTGANDGGDSDVFGYSAGSNPRFRK